MANSIQFKSLAEGLSRAKITVGANTQLIKLKEGDSLYADVDGEKFTLKAADIDLPGFKGSFTFSASELDKAGSDPALVQTDIDDLGDEILTNFFDLAPAPGGVGGGSTVGHLNITIDGDDYPEGTTLTHATLSGKTVPFIMVNNLAINDSADFSKSGSTITYDAGLNTGDKVTILYYSN